MLLAEQCNSWVSDLRLPHRDPGVLRKHSFSNQDIIQHWSHWGERKSDSKVGEEHRSGETTGRLGKKTMNLQLRLNAKIEVSW